MQELTWAQSKANHKAEDQKEAAIWHPEEPVLKLGRKINNHHGFRYSRVVDGWLCSIRKVVRQPLGRESVPSMATSHIPQGNDCNIKQRGLSSGQGALKERASFLPHLAPSQTTTTPDHKGKSLGPATVATPWTRGLTFSAAKEGVGWRRGGWEPSLLPGRRGSA